MDIGATLAKRYFLRSKFSQFFQKKKKKREEIIVFFCDFLDPKFAGKIRQLNALPTVHLYLKLFYQHNSKLVVPLLMVIKAVAKNSKYWSTRYDN